VHLHCVVSQHICNIFFSNVYHAQAFFKENVRHLVWTCGDPISLILGTRIGSLKHLKKTLIMQSGIC